MRTVTEHKTIVVITKDELLALLKDKLNFVDYGNGVLVTVSYNQSGDVLTIIGSCQSVKES